MCTGAYVCILFVLVIKALALLKYIRFISSEVNLQGSLTNGTCLHYATLPVFEAFYEGSVKILD